MEEELNFPVNRADANREEEVNPWREHVIESDTPPDLPQKHPNRGISKTTVADRNDVEVTESFKRRLRDKKPIAPEIQKAIDSA